MSAAVMIECANLSNWLLVSILTRILGAMEFSILAISDHSVLSVSAVINAIKSSNIEGAEKSDPLIITQASNLSMCQFIYLFLYFLRHYGVKHHFAIDISGGFV